MILIGRNLSPFVRRTAASLNLLGLPYEQRPYSTVDNAAELKEFNPLGRVPALLLDSGEVLVDSTFILDVLDEMAGPDRALVPPAGAPRRAVLAALGLAVGATEKTVALFYETRRPDGLVWPANQEKLSAQALAGFAALDRMALAGPWLIGDRLTQADITMTAGLDFAEMMLPEVFTGRFPALAALRDRANTVPGIGATRWVK
ncbi:glutathione S-transferase family protein [Falsiroseomonas selenitidurans]|uniref:Glutathione S-transferase family protein n=1 Tax=Falsiroseomonas selenitidurans TaxID=2716335 RepID=A0ABX1E6A3_9PROT|nr:glutathione S-transferase family protein [Falsiroseomonas selenitidurans]NKC32496.1 glutathione S-transferase family protein [Falsiroseomonas selenitidurans]